MPPVDTLTVVTLNLWHDQADWPRRLGVILDTLRAERPDVICLQEVLQHATLPNQAETLADSLGYRRTFASVDGPERPKRYGNAILFHHPFSESGMKKLEPLDDYRTAAHARVEIDGRPLDVYCTHLHHTAEGGAIRTTQVRDVLGFVRDTRGEGPVLLAGVRVVAVSTVSLVTVGVLFVIAAGLRQTGTLAFFLRRALGRPNSVRSAQARLAPPVIIASAFLNNTPLVAMILPVLVAVCIRTQTPVNGVLMPVGFATIIGGMGTTIGTSTNLLVVDLSARLGMPRFDMFDFTLPVVIAGSASIVLLWLIGPKVLPNRAAPMSDAAPRIFRGVLHVTETSAAAGRTLAEVRAMTNGRIQLDRIERGES